MLVAYKQIGITGDLFIYTVQDEKYMKTRWCDMPEMIKERFNIQGEFSFEHTSFYDTSFHYEGKNYKGTTVTVYETWTQLIDRILKFNNMAKDLERFEVE